MQDLFGLRGQGRSPLELWSCTLSAGGLPFYWGKPRTNGETWGAKKVNPFIFRNTSFIENNACCVLFAIMATQGKPHFSPTHFPITPMFSPELHYYNYGSFLLCYVGTAWSLSGQAHVCIYSSGIILGHYSRYSTMIVHVQYQTEWHSRQNRWLSEENKSGWPRTAFNKKIFKLSTVAC